ncbi:DUF732 domain-containing protein [Antrihabitans sp. YC2-6]|uniref:DUF732 domain-containing protein n=1 Tax=Antrihabitans sp. YC2-6 TaxID=2799498 RepID=UPI0018F7AD0C|nr:DUF732 domain-containing protein [Antrihabitans sp. YC2-6]MBJ8346246.1 DUF732 domain-containing protein [Antrihabitans sp. YC2-6]
MPRQYLARAAFVLTAATLFGGFVSGCGDDDATASSTPSTAEATTAVDGTPVPGAGDNPVNPTTEPGAAATAPPEVPQTVPPGFPGPQTQAQTNPRDQALVAELGRGGITQTPESASAIGGAICRGIQEGTPVEEINTIVLAAVGTDPESTRLSPEDTVRVYVDAAKKTYC